MTTPSMESGDSDIGDGLESPERPPNLDGIDFDSIFNNRDPDGETRRR
ncbi:hypothetical protein ORI20_03195 [Mycobacterium sp. CVI_P3]|uniref:Uncharacterized protein n=1 Tax=Mycobacterium pinniadriaticum TaxID=2994102 RepID=A0ABT3S870_9MYCO|nr:hypothetical protein [Mycobacterium pinniadriaticum]MCX2929266.1 hypothetical protein [Mycobacterium pinniadriaticum]MCX2935691.1 hypothetical protein [Mycobacterium pinniadriaticum]